MQKASFRRPIPCSTGWDLAEALVVGRGRKTVLQQCEMPPEEGQSWQERPRDDRNRALQHSEFAPLSDFRSVEDPTEPDSRSGRLRLSQGQKLQVLEGEGSNVLDDSGLGGLAPGSDGAPGVVSHVQLRSFTGRSSALALSHPIGGNLHAGERAGG